MSWLSIFNKKEKLREEPFDFSLLGADMHAHLIPGIDDGSKSTEESIRLIQGLHELGYKKLILTPHIQADRYKNTQEIIFSGLDHLRKEISKAGIDIELDAAAEYLMDDSFSERLHKKTKFLTFGNKYILVELSYFTQPMQLNELIFELQMQGYQVVLAHPERYTYWHKNHAIYQDLYNRGVFLQMNINSLTGWYSKPSQEVAEKLIEQKLIKFLGTDMHNMVYFNELKKSACMPGLFKAFESNKILNNTLL